jgi:hypothetical protein
MPKRARQIAIVMAAGHECAGSYLRGNDSRLPGTGAWEMRMA